MPTRISDNTALEGLQAQLAAAQDELEDIRLFRPRPEAIEEAQRRVDALRAAVAGFPRAEPPRPPPVTTADEAPPANEPAPEIAPSPPTVSYAEGLRVAWFDEVARPGALVRFLRRTRAHSADELRLQEAGFLQVGRSRAAQATRTRLNALDPARAPPAGATPALRESPAEGGALVDVHDGLTMNERAVLRALHGLGATRKGEPKSAKVLRQYVETQLGLVITQAPVDQLLEVVEQVGPGTPAPLLDTFQPAGAEPILRLTPLGELVLGTVTDLSEPVSRPLATRVPYLLLSGRLGASSMPLPFQHQPVLTQAWRRLLEFEADLPPSMLALPGVDPDSSLKEAEGKVSLEPELSAEAGRAEGLARIFVTALPRTGSWSAARDHLRALIDQRFLDGIAEVRLVATPARVWLELDLEHVVFTALCTQRVQSALRVVFHVRQQGLLGDRTVALTPKRALDYFLEHRLETEAMASEPTFQRLHHRLVLLEATLVGIELAELLTSLLRRCDAIAGRPTLAVWALTHVPVCGDDPELAQFAELKSRWPEALARVAARLTGGLEGWVPSQSLEAGFSSAQANAFLNGRAFRRSAPEVMAELIEVHRALRAEQASTDFLLVRRRVAADLDALNVASWRGLTPG